MKIIKTTNCYFLLLLVILISSMLKFAKYKVNLKYLACDSIIVCNIFFRRVFPLGKMTTEDKASKKLLILKVMSTFIYVTDHFLFFKKKLGKHYNSYCNF